MSNRQDDMRNKKTPKNEEELLTWLRVHFSRGKDPLVELTERFSSPKSNRSRGGYRYDEEA